MILLDDKTDSLLVYCDWLEDNEQLTLATEIRQELNNPSVSTWKDNWREISQNTTIFVIDEVAVPCRWREISHTTIFVIDEVAVPCRNPYVDADLYNHGNVGSNEWISGVGGANLSDMIFGAVVGSGYIFDEHQWDCYNAVGTVEFTGLYDFKAGEC